MSTTLRLRNEEGEAWSRGLPIISNGKQSKRGNAGTAVRLLHVCHSPGPHRVRFAREREILACSASQPESALSYIRRRLYGSGRRIQSTADTR